MNPADTPDTLSIVEPRHPSTGAHTVQFYETSEFLNQAIANFSAEGIDQGDAVIIIATGAHRASLERRLNEQGYDVPRLQEQGRLNLIDAAATLDTFMVEGRPDRGRFERNIGTLIHETQQRYPRIRAYGEMVNLLWAAGDLAATIALEELWNDLAKTYTFNLLCGYDMTHFHSESHDAAFQQVCHSHSHVISAKDFDLAPGDDATTQRRTIARLEQQARVLQNEIAERKRVEQTLQETLRQLTTERARFEAVLRQMPAGVVIVEAPHGRVVLANEHIVRIFPLPFDLVTYGGLEGVHADGRTYQHHECPIARALGGETLSAYELEYRSAQRCGTLEVSAAPIRDLHGDIVAAVATYLDITERKRAQDERLKASKIESIGLLAAGIAHDFNNILTAILGNVSLAKLLSETDSAVVEALGQAEQASVRARDLTQQLLTFSKGGAPIKKIASLAAFLRETTAFALRGTRVSLVLDVAPDLAPALFDAGQLSQVMNNLLINAVQAMPGGGRVTVAARNTRLVPGNPYQLPSGAYVEIKVCDEGEGISPEHLSRIFDPYFTTKKTGSGLGLATSYSIIKRHDGYIGVSSRLHEGTQFTILLRASPGDASGVAPTDIALKSGSGRILLMDDEETVRTVGANLLRRFGYDVVTVGDGAAALQCYAAAMEAAQPFDMVILDLTVPGAMGGKECIEHLRKLHPAVRALVSSGYSVDPIMSDYQLHGFVGVIAKPYELRDLSDAIQSALGNADRERPVLA